LTRLEDHKAVGRHLAERYGSLDVLVNNAGVELEGTDFGSTFNMTSTVTPEILRRTFETNFFSVVALTQALLPLIRNAPAGRIVNLSSILGSLTLHSDPSSGIYDKKAFAYDASKTALNAFTVHLAQELRGTKINVNSAHPGWVRTELGGPAVIAKGRLKDVAIGNSVMLPSGVVCPMLFPLASVNQRLPSGPAVIPKGELLGVGMGNSVMLPSGVICPMLFPLSSVNQRLPSGPAVIPEGRLVGVGTGNSLNDNNRRSSNRSSAGRHLCRRRLLTRAVCKNMPYLLVIERVNIKPSLPIPNSRKVEG
jgi:NAD(P)-dependent dehydrogenase (short-subunit alcohol dehydrogenase family)